MTQTKYSFVFPWLKTSNDGKRSEQRWSCSLWLYRYGNSGGHFGTSLTYSYIHFTNVYKKHGTGPPTANVGGPN